MSCKRPLLRLATTWSNYDDQGILCFISEYVGEGKDRYEAFYKAIMEVWE
jgi:hypothetical protein